MYNPTSPRTFLNKLCIIVQNSQDISRLVNESSVMSAAARRMLDHARGNISEARSQADSNLNESRAVFNKSVEAQSKAYEAMNVSSQFKVSCVIVFSYAQSQWDSFRGGGKTTLSGGGPLRAPVDSVL